MIVGVVAVLDRVAVGIGDLGQFLAGGIVSERGDAAYRIGDLKSAVLPGLYAKVSVRPYVSATVEVAAGIGQGGGIAIAIDDAGQPVDRAANLEWRSRELVRNVYWVWSFCVRVKPPPPGANVSKYPGSVTYVPPGP